MSERLYTGCESCRNGVLSGHWSPPYLMCTSIEYHARLHHCSQCGSWWEENEREAHVIPEEEAQRTFHEHFLAEQRALAGVAAYHAAGKPLVCELDVQPFQCEFWPIEELRTYNSEYEVPRHTPGFFGFATSGGGEMFAVSPSGSVVCLPFIGMEPSAAVAVANSWKRFEALLRNAL